MAGRVIEITKLTGNTFNISGRTGEDQGGPIGPRATDSSWASSGVIQAVVTSFSGVAGATLSLVVFNVVILTEDPSHVAGGDGTPLVSIAISGTGLHTAALPSPIGEMLLVGFNATSGTTAGGLSLTSAVHLILRDS